MSRARSNDKILNRSLFRPILRSADIVVLLLTAAITVFCAVRVYGKSAADAQFVIQGKKERWIYYLNQTARIAVSGPLGNTNIELTDGRAWISSSPCANQICVASGSIHQGGQWIACLPNAVLVRLEGSVGSGRPGESSSSDGETENAELDGTVW